MKIKSQPLGLSKSSLAILGFDAEAEADNHTDRMPFLANGPVGVRFTKSLTFLSGENGSGKTTLLAAIAARCGIRPGGGGSYRETDSDRESAAMSGALRVILPPGPNPRGLFMRADKLAAEVGAAGPLRMASSNEWRKPSEQSRGEGALSLMASLVDPSERMLFLLDEPETGLSPQRQMALLCQLDELHRDGRSQAIIATHSPILMSHPNSDILWLDETGIERRDLEEIPHFREMRRFMRDHATALARLLA